MKLVVRYKYETRRMAFVEFGIARLAALARDHGFFLTSLTRVTPDPSLLIFPNEFTYPPPRPLIGGPGAGRAMPPTPPASTKLIVLPNSSLS
jgi:hypothetical protein